MQMVEIQKSEQAGEGEGLSETEVILGEAGEPNSIFQAGRIFWLVIVLCGVNECLYFPFLDNANELIINRFCIPYEQTGYFLSIPFLAASTPPPTQCSARPPAATSSPRSRGTNSSSTFQ